jgi:hypothetical protein
VASGMAGTSSRQPLTSALICIHCWLRVLRRMPGLSWPVPALPTVARSWRCPSGQQVAPCSAGGRPAARVQTVRAGFGEVGKWRIQSGREHGPSRPAGRRRAATHPSQPSSNPDKGRETAHRVAL